MNSFSFESQGEKTHLVYEISSDEYIDSMSLGMITHNHIAGLAETSFMQMDEKKFLKYDVTSKVAVKQFFDGPVNKKRLLGVFRGIVNAMLSAEEYMINAGSILLDTSYIFSDVTTCDTVLVCLPVESPEKSSTSTDVGIFFKNITFSTQYDQTENCDHVAKIINYLNSAPVFSLTEFKKVLDSLDDTQNVKSGTSMSVQSAPVKTVIQNVPQRQPQIQKQTRDTVVHQPVVPVRHEEPQQVQSKSETQDSVDEPKKSESGSSEKMSALYLLRHYSKENAELYKAQKNSGGKAEKANKKSDLKDHKEKESKKKKKKDSNDLDVDFRVPGAPEIAVSKKLSNETTEPTPFVTPTKSENTQQRTTAEVFGSIQSEPKPTYSTLSHQTTNFGETVVLTVPTSGETTVLLRQTPEEKASPHLIRKKNNEKILINKPVFRIGKERSYVDYFVADNTAISRSHANIIAREGQYFIVDTNSKNHTYVNGEMIDIDVEVPIEHGTLITLANENFEFRMH